MSSNNFSLYKRAMLGFTGNFSSFSNSLHFEYAINEALNNSDLVHLFQKNSVQVYPPKNPYPVSVYILLFCISLYIFYLLFMRCSSCFWTNILFPFFILLCSLINRVLEVYVHLVLLFCLCCSPSLVLKDLQQFWLTYPIITCFVLFVKPAIRLLTHLHFGRETKNLNSWVFDLFFT